MTKAAQPKAWTLHTWADGTQRSWAEPEEFTPPYTVPSAGNVGTIGTNDHQDVRPVSHSAGNWDATLFSSFGAGAFVEDYSDGGAYVLAGTGGHNHAANVDAAIFDFEDATWKYLANGNGVSQLDNTGSAADYDVADTNGSPYYEITGSVVPAPTHPYANAVPLPSSLGGGSKGSFAYVGRGAVCVEAAVSTAAHRMDLSDGDWSRVTTDQAPSAPGGTGSEATVLFDGSRYFLMYEGNHNFQTLHYLDSADWTWKTLGSFSFPSGVSGHPVYVLDPDRDLILWQRGTRIDAIDLDDPDSGWTELTITGTLGDADQTHWCYHPTTGRFYRVREEGGTSIERLTPPASSPLSNAWVVDSISLSGDSMPSMNTSSGGAGPYRSLMYVPAIDCLARICGSSSAQTAETVVQLIQPE